MGWGVPKGSQEQRFETLCKFYDFMINKSKHIFRVHIKHYWLFEGVTPKQCYTLAQTSSNTDIFRELLSNNTSHSSRVYIKRRWHLQSSWQTILHPFPEPISNNTDIFRELLANNTKHFSRVYTKQYWHFQRLSSKLNYSKKFFQSSYHTTLTLSESYYQTILFYLDLISNSIHFHRVITKQ